MKRRLLPEPGSELLEQRSQRRAGNPQAVGQIALRAGYAVYRARYRRGRCRGGEQGGDGGCGDRRPRAALPHDAVLHAAVVGGAVVDVLLGPFDDLSRHDNARVAAGSEPLHLGDAG